MNKTQLKQISPELTLVQYNEIPVLELKHTVGTAKIALQGAHLFHWQPTGQQPVFWLSEIEPFKLGTAIRGGVPICYPWFGGVKSPSHGTARIRLWTLLNFDIQADRVRLELALFDESNIIEAKLTLVFAKNCTLTFTHFGQDTAQVALHSYFQVGDITQTEIVGLPTQCFNSLTKQSETVSSPRRISETVDCIYSVSEGSKQEIVDLALNRKIHIQHYNASDVVVWNPWHKATSGMSETAYRTMVCIETARIEKHLKQKESVSVEISVVDK